jgi:hypothetical protein
MWKTRSEMDIFLKPIVKNGVPFSREAWSEIDETAPGRLMPVVYAELWRPAAQYLRRERPDHTLEAIAWPGAAASSKSLAQSEVWQLFKHGTVLCRLLHVIYFH